MSPDSEGVGRSLSDLVCNRLLSLDGISGSLAVAIGALFGFQALSVPVGTVSEMGPGFFPLTLSAILVICGVAMISMTKGTAAPRDERPPFSWTPVRVLFVVVGGELVFGLLVEPLGFVPALAIPTFAICATASGLGIVRSFIVTASIVLAAWLIFIVALSLQWPLFGWALSSGWA